MKNNKFLCKAKDIFAEFKKRDSLICAITAIIIIFFTAYAYRSDKGKQNHLPSDINKETTTSYSSTELETRLSGILKQINGVGNVSIMVTFPDDVSVTASSSSPTAIGAVIIAEGAANPEVRIKIQQAVQTALGIEARQIKIFEMGS